MSFGMSIMRLSLMCVALGALFMFALPNETAFAHGARGYVKALSSSHVGSRTFQVLRQSGINLTNAHHVLAKVSVTCSVVGGAAACDETNDDRNSDCCGSDCQPVMAHLLSYAFVSDRVATVSARERAILVSRCAVDIKPPRL